MLTKIIKTIPKYMLMMQKRLHHHQHQQIVIVQSQQQSQQKHRRTYDDDSICHTSYDKNFNPNNNINNDLFKRFVYFNTNIKATFSVSKDSIKSTQQQRNQTFQEKLVLIEQNFQKKWNVYNFQTLIKMYRILRMNNVAIASQALENFQYRASIDIQKANHACTNLLLQTLCQTQAKYARNSKLFRSLNVKILRGRQIKQADKTYKTLNYLRQLDFPVTTIARFVSHLVQNASQPDKNEDKDIFEQMSVIAKLKTCLLCLQFDKIDFQIKRRVLKHIIQAKAKSILEMSYFVAIIHVFSDALSRTIDYQSKKKSLYQVAFNPYRNMNMQDQENIEKDNENEKDNEKNTQTTTTTQPPTTQAPTNQTNQNTTNTQQTNKQKQKQKQIEQNILKTLLQSKTILIQNFNKTLDLTKIEKSLDLMIQALLEDNLQEQITFNQQKQIIKLMIATNAACIRSQLIGKLILKIFNQSFWQGGGGEGGQMNNQVKSTSQPQSQSQPQPNSQKFLSVRQFTLMLRFLKHYNIYPQIIQNYSQFIDKYNKKYFNLMSLEEKLIILHAQSQIVKEKKIDLQLILNLLNGLGEGESLNKSEYYILLKILKHQNDRLCDQSVVVAAAEVQKQNSTNSSTSSIDKQKKQQLIKQIWYVIQKQIDQDLKKLINQQQKLKQQQQKQQQQKQQKSQQ